MNRYLLYHSFSDDVFVVFGKEERDKAIENGVCEDVTGIESFEKRNTDNTMKDLMSSQKKEADDLLAALLDTSNQKDAVVDAPDVKSEATRLLDYLVNTERQQANIAAAPDIPPAPVQEMNVIQVGDGFRETISVPKTDDAVEAIKNRAIATAMSIGLKMGVHPLFPMTTPKNRVVGFPFQTPRQGQLEAVDDCIDILLSGSNCLLEAATGVGKSAVAVAIASYFKTSWLLVGRNDLIDQWENDFSDFSAIGFYKSRQRFLCSNALRHPGKIITCADTKACKEGKAAIEKNIADWEEATERYQKDKSLPPPGPRPSGIKPCPYACNRDVSLSKDHTACTLALGLTAFKYMAEYPLVKKRRIMVVDECSELESELIKFHTCTISTKTLARGLTTATWASLGMDIPEKITGDGFIKVEVPSPDPDTTVLAYLEHFKPSNLTEAHLWALIAQNALEEVVGILEKKTIKVTGQMAGSDGTISPEDQKYLDSMNAENEDNIETCKGIIRQVKTAHAAILGKLPYCYEVVPSDRGGHWQMVLKPLEARGLFDRLIAEFGEQFLFVSATTGTAEGFKAAHGMTCGLKRIEIPSPFPAQNRPVIIHPVANMSSKTYERDLPEMLRAISSLVQSTGGANKSQDHQNQRGIIHTYTTKLTNSIYDHLKKNGLGHRAIILKGSGNDREEAMKRFKSIPNGILISPSAMLGLSLNDDLARWQIIAKVPYAYLGDESIKHRKEVIDGWYEWQTAKDLIQTLGRIVRSKDDWGYTYILDECFVKFYRYNKDSFPSYVKEAFHGV